MKRIMMGLAAGSLVALSLTACGNGPADDPSPPAVVDVGNGDVGRIIDVNGVQCVVVNGYRTTAVSCNWEAYNSSKTP